MPRLLPSILLPVTAGIWMTSSHHNTASRRRMRIVENIGRVCFSKQQAGNCMPISRHWLYAAVGWYEDVSFGVMPAKWNNGAWECTACTCQKHKYTNLQKSNLKFNNYCSRLTFCLVNNTLKNTSSYSCGSIGTETDCVVSNIYIQQLFVKLMLLLTAIWLPFTKLDSVANKLGSS